MDIHGIITYSIGILFFPITLLMLIGRCCNRVSEHIYYRTLNL